MKAGLLSLALLLSSCARPVGSVSVSFSIDGDDDNAVRNASFVEGNDLVFAFKGQNDPAFERFSTAADANPINTKQAFPLDEDVLFVVAVATNAAPGVCVLSGTTTFLVKNHIAPTADDVENVVVPLTAGGDAAKRVDPDGACR
jgi:hypothetical protein